MKSPLRIAVAMSAGLTLQALFFTLALPCAAQSITIRIVDSRSGKALAGQAISVQFLYDWGGSSPSVGAPDVRVRSDENGQARVPLPHPIPDSLWVRIRLKKEAWHCTCSVLTKTIMVLNDGFASGPPGEAIKIQGKRATARPGEMLVVPRPYSFWERLLYSLAKG